MIFLAEVGEVVQVVLDDPILPRPRPLAVAADDHQPRPKPADYSGGPRCTRDRTADDETLGRRAFSALLQQQSRP